MNNIIATIRKDKIDKKGAAPIYIHIYEGEKLIAKKSTGHKISPANWCDITRRVKGHPQATLINAIITKELNQANERVFSARLNDEDVRTAIRKHKSRDAGLEDFVSVQLRERNFAPETARNYRIYLHKVLHYAPGVSIRKIDIAFLQSYESHLRNIEGNAHNTIASNMKFIDSMLNAAMKTGIIDRSPFRDYKRPRYKQTERTFLTAEELDRIEEGISGLDYGLQNVACMFLFMARTGLRYSDAIRFRAEDHIEDDRIVIVTQKTGKKTSLFINEKIGPLIRDISDNPIRISQVDFNRKLKVIAATLGIKKNLTSHVGRHSFGASLVDMGISIEVARELLTHGSTSMTRIYYHMKNKNLDEAMKRFNKKPGI
jgi:integrase/recombinase XerD